ncbi:MAG: PAS domain-containing protein [Bacteroidales bacterium]|nr:PAS domain-containing protein [Bacteroidales bacterium]
MEHTVNTERNNAKPVSGQEPRKTGTGVSKWFFSLKNKLRVVILASATGLALLILLAAFFILRSYQSRETFSDLKAISQFKSHQLAQYFHQLENQLLLAIRDVRVSEAYDGLSSAFGMIESDSYELPEYQGLSTMSEMLVDYYKTDIIPVLQSKIDNNVSQQDILPADDKTAILQFLYIANNGAPIGFRHKMINAGDQSSYTAAHQQYHPFFRELMSALGVSDIILVNGTTGDILYTCQKEIDFGTNIFTGPFKSSNLALACQKALSAGPGKPVYTDMELYLPARFQPSSFIALTINTGAGQKAVVAFRFAASGLDNILAGGYTGNINRFIETGGNLYLVGDDYTYRSNDLRLKFQDADFVKSLIKNDHRKKAVAQVDSLNTTVRIIYFDHRVFEKAALGYDDTQVFRDAAGTKVFAVVSPLQTRFGDWFLVVQKTKADTFIGTNKLLLWGLLVLAALTIVVIIFTNRFGNMVSLKLNAIKNNLHSAMLGQESGHLAVISVDELGTVVSQVNDLSVRIKNASDFALEMSNGNMEALFEPQGENDVFAGSLNKLKDSLVDARKEEQKRKIEDEMRNWTTQGIAKFNDLLRHENDNIEKFTYSIIKNLVAYLNANQGSIFLLEGDEGDEQVLNLTACIAWDQQKFLKKQIKIGEGLVGQVVQERQTIYLKEIPEDYITITSGLGDANPRSLLIVPMMYNDVITGVFEIASFNEFKPHEIEFVEKVAESTTITLNAVRLNVKTKLLLEESNERAEELAAQEEEMRQNLEELKATQEEMTRVKEESAIRDAQQREQQKALLDQLKKNNEDLLEQTHVLEWEKLMFNRLMDSIPARVTYKDTESRYIRINQAKVKALGISSQDEVLGKTDFDIFGASHGQKALDAEKQMIRSGVSVENKEELIRFKDGRVTWGSTTRVPLRDEDGTVKGSLVFTWDITDLKNSQFRLEVNNKIVHHIASNMPVLHYSIDQKGAVIFFRGKGLKYLKLKEDELTGKDFYKMYPELKTILEVDLGDEGYSFVQHVNDHELRHIIFSNRTTSGGYTGIAFELCGTE